MVGTPATDGIFAPRPSPGDDRLESIGDDFAVRPGDLVSSSPARLSAIAAAAAVGLYVVFTAVPFARRIDAAVAHRDLEARRTNGSTLLLP
jgi:hypothetical protein